jgi:hypothetical protein
MFAQDFKQFFSSKSNVTGVTAIMLAIYLVVVGDYKSAVESAMAGISVICIKDAVVKVK